MKKTKSIIIIGLIAIALMGCYKPAKVYTKEVATVHQGDTLWCMASRYSGDMYMLEYLAEVKSLPENKDVLSPNRLLQPGDKIVFLKTEEVKK